MDNIILIKRRLASSPNDDIPVLENGELAFNEKTYELYYGAETRTITIGGSGAFVSLEGTQTIIGDKTFSGNTTVADVSFLSGSTINFQGNRIRNVGTPTVSADASNKFYVDDLISKQVSLSGAQIIPGAKVFSSNTSILKDLTVFGSLSVFGDSTLIETTVRSASAMQITNSGTGPALKVAQVGANDIALFYHDSNVAFAIKDGGIVGIGTNQPNELLTVAGNVSAANNIYAAAATLTRSVSAPALSGSFFGDGSNLTNLNANNITQGTLSNSRLPSIVTISTSISAPVLSGSFFGDIKGSTGNFSTSITAPTFIGNVQGTTANFASSVSASTLSGSFFGNGSNLTNLNASNITQGTLSNSRLPSIVTISTSISAPEVRGAFYGDGSNLTGLPPTYVPPADATFISSVSAPALSGTFYGDGSRLTGISRGDTLSLTGGTLTGGLYGTTAEFSTSVKAPSMSGIFYGTFVGNGAFLTNVTGATGSEGIDPTKLPLTGGTLLGDLYGTRATFNTSISAPALSGTFYGDGSKLTGITSSSVFTSDLTVSLPGGKTFGRYNSGDVIPATGKTPAEVIQLAISAPINPTVSLTSPTSIAFNQTNINNVLNFSHVINSLGASVSSASLEWRRNNTGSWTQLSTAVNSSYTHTLTDTEFNTAPFNYRYIIVDSVGATATATANITPASYSAPTMSITVAAQSITSPESNSTREKGNVASTISGSITRNSTNTSLSSYVVQYRINSGSYTNIGAPVSISGSSATISSFTHTPTGASTADSISYRIAVTDSYTTSNGTASTINFYYLIFYGPSSSTPINSSSVRALSSRSFTNTLSNPFILNTGTVETKFSVAMPSTLAISLVQDLDASNATLTNNYTNNPFNVNDGGGNAVSYNVYTLSIATPYSSSHRHQITRA